MAEGPVIYSYQLSPFDQIIGFRFRRKELAFFTYFMELISFDPFVIEARMDHFTVGRALSSPLFFDLNTLEFPNLVFEVRYVKVLRKSFAAFLNITQEFFLQSDRRTLTHYGGVGSDNILEPYLDWEIPAQEFERPIRQASAERYGMLLVDDVIPVSVNVLMTDGNFIQEFDYVGRMELHATETNFFTSQFDPDGDRILITSLADGPIHDVTDSDRQLARNPLIRNPVTNLNDIMHVVRSGLTGGTLNLLFYINGVLVLTFPILDNTAADGAGDLLGVQPYAGGFVAAVDGTGLLLGIAGGAALLTIITFARQPNGSHTISQRAFSFTGGAYGGLDGMLGVDDDGHGYILGKYWHDDGGGPRALVKIWAYDGTVVDYLDEDPDALDSADYSPLDAVPMLARCCFVAKKGDGYVFIFDNGDDSLHLPESPTELQPVFASTYFFNASGTWDNAFIVVRESDSGVRRIIGSDGTNVDVNGLLPAGIDITYHGVVEGRTAVYLICTVTVSISPLVLRVFHVSNAGTAFEYNWLDSSLPIMPQKSSILRLQQLAQWALE